MAPQNTLGSAWRSFWHTMTSNDRHASHDSPFRTGVSSGGRHNPLTSVSASGDEATTTLASSTLDRDESVSSTYFGHAPSPATPGAPYSPGLRSMQRRQSEDVISKGASAEVQMQTFSDGLPPPPPVKHSWKRIDRWAEDHYEELFDNLSPACTQNDINELEHHLDCTLPQDVRESLQIHDGQERGGNPTGIIFSSMLLDCEEIVDEWKQWRRVNEEYLNNETPQETGSKSYKDGGAESSATAAAANGSNGSNSSNWKEELLARQDSQPSNAIQKAYCHPGWIPLVRDWGGNNIAVDLSPGSAGKWGQVILMGRDYDCKFVIARSWGAFLATFADDLTSRKSYVEEETGLLKLREFKGQNIEPGYLDILRWRTDQKYGRKPPKKKPADIRINSTIPPVVSKSSPYSDSDRGRSPQRFNGKSIATPSPRTTISSPLARVAEEAPSKAAVSGIPETEALISTESPRMSVTEETKIQDFASNSNKKETDVVSSELSGMRLDDPNAHQELKTVDI